MGRLIAFERIQWSDWFDTIVVATFSGQRSLFSDAVSVGLISKHGEKQHLLVDASGSSAVDICWRTSGESSSDEVRGLLTVTTTGVGTFNCVGVGLCCKRCNLVCEAVQEFAFQQQFDCDISAVLALPRSGLMSVGRDLMMCDAHASRRLAAWVPEGICVSELHRWHLRPHQGESAILVLTCETSSPAPLTAAGGCVRAAVETSAEPPALPVSWRMPSAAVRHAGSFAHVAVVSAGAECHGLAVSCRIVLDEWTKPLVGVVSRGQAVQFGRDSSGTVTAGPSERRWMAARPLVERTCGVEAPLLAVIEGGIVIVDATPARQRALDALAAGIGPCGSDDTLRALACPVITWIQQSAPFKPGLAPEAMSVRATRAGTDLLDVSCWPVPTLHARAGRCGEGDVPLSCEEVGDQGSVICTAGLLSLGTAAKSGMPEVAYVEARIARWQLLPVRRGPEPCIPHQLESPAPLLGGVLPLPASLTGRVAVAVGFEDVDGCALPGTLREDAGSIDDSRVLWALGELQSLQQQALSASGKREEMRPPQLPIAPTGPAVTWTSTQHRVAGDRLAGSVASLDVGWHKEAAVHVPGWPLGQILVARTSMSCVSIVNGHAGMEVQVLCDDGGVIELWGPAEGQQAHAVVKAEEVEVVPLVMHTSRPSIQQVFPRCTGSSASARIISAAAHSIVMGVDPSLMGVVRRRLRTAAQGQSPSLQTEPILAGTSRMPAAHSIACLAHRPFRGPEEVRPPLLDLSKLLSMPALPAHESAAILEPRMAVSGAVVARAEVDSAVDVADRRKRVLHMAQELMHVPEIATQLPPDWSRTPPSPLPRVWTSALPLHTCTAVLVAQRTSPNREQVLQSQQISARTLASLPQSPQPLQDWELSNTKGFRVWVSSTSAARAVERRRARALLATQTDRSHVFSELEIAALRALPVDDEAAAGVLGDDVVRAGPPVEESRPDQLQRAHDETSSTKSGSGGPRDNRVAQTGQGGSAEGSLDDWLDAIGPPKNDDASHVDLSGVASKALRGGWKTAIEAIHAQESARQMREAASLSAAPAVHHTISDLAAALESLET